MTNKLVARPRARKIQLSGRSIQRGGVKAIDVQQFLKL